MIPGADTIAAIATARGRGAVAIVRVSGPDAFEIASAVSSRPPSPGRIVFASFRAPASRSSGSRVLLDRGVLLAFAAPRSYTGEDVVEFQCHGGSVVPRRILDAVLSCGARLALRGEFTQRAFLNGKLDYSQARGVIDLIDAKTDRSADAAVRDLFGQPGVRDGLRAAEEALYRSLVALSSEMEHSLDVDEGDLDDAFFAAMRDGVARADAEFRRLQSLARRRSILRDGALVVIAGRPNAGKSSLLNALEGSSRAIVSDIPGTTRDAVETWVDFDGWPVRLVDTAGIRDAGEDGSRVDPVEAEGIARARDLVSRADVAIVLEPCAGECADASGFTSAVLAMRPGRPSVLVASKCDLAPGGASASRRLLRVSAATGEGLEALKGAVAAILEKENALAGATLSGSPDESLSMLLAAHAPIASLLEPGCADDPVVAANAVRSAASALGDALGLEYSEDMLDRLFSRFCVGK